VGVDRARAARVVAPVLEQEVVARLVGRLDAHVAERAARDGVRAEQHRDVVAEEVGAS
jgi:hypothetical protein